MFDAPEIIKQIPDIKQIYAINDTQSDEIDKALDDLESDIFVDTMTEEVTEHWEEFLSLTKQTGDTLSDRRTKVKAKILERLPYSYRVLARKIAELCDELDEIELSDDRMEMKVYAAFNRDSQRASMAEMLENCLPLTVIFDIINRKSRSTSRTMYLFVNAGRKRKKRYIKEVSV